MNVSIFGGSGFVGYDFVRHLLVPEEGFTPTIYSTNPANLTNLSRHDVDIRLVHYGELQDIQLPPNTEYLINFSHPFGTRDNLTPRHQISSLLKFFHKQLDSNLTLKLIHISSMSVYEPFAPNHEFDEKEPIDPPKSDTYAKNKADIDKQILAWPSVQDRILLLRPTVVYGPFGIPWTDNIIKNFLVGPVHHFGLRGRIQPIWVSDISKFLVSGLSNFKPGVYNLAGPDVVTWKEFLHFFERLVGCGELKQHVTSEELLLKPSIPMAARIKNGLKRVAANSTVRKIAKPFFRPFPHEFKQKVKRRMLPPSNQKHGQNDMKAQGPYCRPFFEEDRLISTVRLRRDFPDFSPTHIQATASTMKDYISFRFEEG